MAISKASGKLPDRPKTVQRTYRFDTKVFGAFEDDCARHLSNPKRVIEAMILHWLGASPDKRAAMAQIHRQQIGAGSQDEQWVDRRNWAIMCPHRIQPPSCIAQMRFHLLPGTQ